MMAAPNQINLQDSFLNQIRKESVPVVIYLKNGVQLRGLVKGFDAFTVIMEDAGKQQMAYKHTISTIAPLSAFTIKPKEMNPGRPVE